MVFYGLYIEITTRKIMNHGLKETMPSLFFTLSLVCLYSILATLVFGILAYGIAYFLVHDIFIHQRFKLFRNANNWYSRGVRRAHKMHHKHLGKGDGECFGMLFVPFKYFKK
mgnify:CR=1 FL=1